MIISFLVAMDEKRGIGKAGGLPWRLSSDMKRFRELTMGHHIIVGRKTFESIGKPLPGRQMIIVTRSESLSFEDVSSFTRFKPLSVLREKEARANCSSAAALKSMLRCSA